MSLKWLSRENQFAVFQVLLDVVGFSNYVVIFQKNWLLGVDAAIAKRRNTKD